MEAPSQLTSAQRSKDQILLNLREIKSNVQEFDKIPVGTKGCFVQVEAGTLSLYQFVPSGGVVYSSSRALIPSYQAFQSVIWQWITYYTIDTIPRGIQKIARFFADQKCDVLNMGIETLVDKIVILFNQNLTHLDAVFTPEDSQNSETLIAFEEFNRSVKELTFDPFLRGMERFVKTYESNEEDKGKVTDLKDRSLKKLQDAFQPFKRRVELYFERRSLMSSGVLPSGIFQLHLPNGGHQLKCFVRSKPVEVPDFISKVNQVLLRYIREEASSPLSKEGDPLVNILTRIQVNKNLRSKECHFASAGGIDFMRNFADVDLEIAISTQRSNSIFVFSVNRRMLQNQPYFSALFSSNQGKKRSPSIFAI